MAFTIEKPIGYKGILGLEYDYRKFKKQNRCDLARFFQ